MISYIENTSHTVDGIYIAGRAMNWADGEFHRWGEMQLPPELVGEAQRAVDLGGMTERYTFRNPTDRVVTVPAGAAGVWTPFSDDYESAEVCHDARCHAHIWCGGTAAWVDARAMNAQPPHLGLALTVGSITSYAIERRETSNDRGDILLLTDAFTLAPGETYTLAWTIFSYESDFFAALRRFPNQVQFTADTFTFFADEPVRIAADGVPLGADTALGYHETAIRGAICRYQVLPPFETLLRTRCGFIVRHQQIPDGEFAGAYVIYDNETGERIHDEACRDHNSGRERIGMGLLIAKYLQSHPDAALHDSLNAYTAFLLRGYFDESTGEVFNAYPRDNSYRRIYNNAWFASYFRELYRLDGNVRWLRCMMGALRDLYAHGGTRFYPLALEATDAVRALETAGLTAERDELMGLLRANGAFILQNGTHYPALEVNYEDNIVVPAGMLLVQLYELTGELRYLSAAQEHLRLHDIFVGFQPDARMHGAAIHHWDDHYFGKHGLFGDTFPHYWSTAGALFSARMAAATGSADDLAHARAGMRACLCSFFPDGRATCAIVTPRTVNGRPGGFIDPWANDQDWALYHAMQFDAQFGL